VVLFFVFLGKKITSVDLVDPRGMLLSVDERYLAYSQKNTEPPGPAILNSLASNTQEFPDTFFARAYSDLASAVAFQTRLKKRLELLDPNKFEQGLLVWPPLLLNSRITLNVKIIGITLLLFQEGPIIPVTDSEITDQVRTILLKLYEIRFRKRISNGRLSVLLQPLGLSR
jgi:hypothetical protein